MEQPRKVEFAFFSNTHLFVEVNLTYDSHNSCVHMTSLAKHFKMILEK